jgi:hypothetical protein
VYDEDLIAGVANTGKKGPTFAATHADYVVLMDQFKDADDDYWKGVGTMCSRATCIDTFGDYDPSLPAPPSDARQFQIKDALQQWLELTPRKPDEQSPTRNTANLRRMAECCFPSGASYVVRASQQWVLRSDVNGIRHRVITKSVPAGTQYTGDQFDCVLDDNPRKKYYESRVFEVCTEPNPNPENSVCDLSAGCQGGAYGVAADSTGTSCVYDAPTARFAVYTGAKKSVADMSFAWQTSGGFSPMRIDFATLSSQVSPNALVGLPSMDLLTVVDGSSLGLVLLSLDNLAPLSPALN